MHNEKNQPLRKVRSGKFQVTLWRFQRKASGDPNATGYSEVPIDVERACIQYSRFDHKTGQWKNQSIWIPVHEVRDLASVVDQLNEAGG